jgi:hypothetical protein
MRNVQGNWFKQFGIGLLLLSVAIVTLWQMRAPVHITHEDGFYYYEIARNLARGLGSSFDGVNPTNGYQPLWLGMLVPIYWVALAGLDAVRVGMALQGILLAGTLLLLITTVRLKSSYAAALLAALLWLTWMSAESFSGLETSLHALCLCLIGLLYLKWFIPTLPKNLVPFLVLGIACSVAFLARLDTIALSAILGVALAVRGWRAHNSSWRNWLAFVIPLLFTAGAYALLNLRFFGSPEPISGIVKATWSQTLVTRNPLYAMYGWFGAKLDNFVWSITELSDGYGFYVTIGTFGAGGLCLASVLPIVPIRWRAALKRLLVPLAPFLLYSFVNYAAYALLFDQNLSWTASYYLIQPWLTVLFAAALFDAVWHRLSTNGVGAPRALQIARYAVLLVPLALLVRDLQMVQPDTTQGLSIDPVYAGIEWARTHLPSDAVIGAWNAGTIGYLTERRTVNLDGVVNTYQFFKTDRFDLCDYWKKQGVTYLMDAFIQDRALSVVPTFPAYASCAASLHRVWSDARPETQWRLQVYRIDLP